MRRKRFQGAGFCIALTCVFCLTGCGRDDRTVQTGADTVKTVYIDPATAEQTSSVVVGDILKRDIYDGIITPYVEMLSFPENGVFSEYCVSMGDEVTKGQILAVTDTGDTKEQISGLEEQLAELQADYEYNVATRENQKAILQARLAIVYEQIEAAEYMTPEYTQLCIDAGYLVSDMDRLDLEIGQLTEEYELDIPYLEEQLEEYKEQLKGNVITAPFDGVVVQLQAITAGDHVSEGKSYIALADLTQYLAVGDYVRRDIAAKAQNISVFLNGETYPAEYVPMDTDAYNELIRQGETAYSTYVIEFPETMTAEEKQDLFGHAVLIVVQQDSRTQVLTVPWIAVQQDGSLWYCYRDNGGKREKVYVELGLTDGMNYEVLSGLEEGDAVYIE